MSRPSSALNHASEIDRRQPTHVMTVAQYIVGRLRARRARQLAAAQALEFHTRLLDDIGISRQEAIFGR